MSSMTTIHIIPSIEGEWSVKVHEVESLGTFPTEGLAVARAWELARDRATAEVVVHSLTGNVRSNLLIQNLDEPTLSMDIYEDAEDEALCREAERKALSRADLRALMARIVPSTIDYSQEDDELPC